MRARGFSSGAASPEIAVFERVLDRGLAGAATRLLLMSSRLASPGSC